MEQGKFNIPEGFLAPEEYAEIKVSGVPDNPYFS